LEMFSCFLSNAYEPHCAQSIPSNYIFYLFTPNFHFLLAFIFPRCYTLYGLKQAPRAQFEKFSYVIGSLGFRSSDHDSALFVIPHVLNALFSSFMLMT